jgi:hypothetical protein
MELKDEILGKMGLVTPDDPADADVGETKLVTRSVDGDDTRKFKVPEEFWCGEGSDERA